MDFKLMIRRMTQMTLGDWLRVQMMHFASPASTLRFVVLMFLMMFVGVSDILGQSAATLPNGDGYYYIINMEAANGGHAYQEDADDNWYLCPTEGNYDYLHWQGNREMPFLTTHNLGGRLPKYLWRVVRKENDDYYYIIHDADSKYLTVNAYPGGDDKNTRRRVHIQETVTNDALFKLIESGTSNGTSTYNIASNTYGDANLLNPAGNNNANYGTNNSRAGLIGFYSDNAGSKWFFEFVKKCVTPQIQVSVDGIVTITTVTPGATIYYTTNGDTPTTSSTKYSGDDGTGPFPVAATVKAIAVKTEFTDSEVAEASFAQTATPTIDQTNCDNTIAINCTDAGATIIYTTDESTPSTSNGTIYTEPFIPATGATVKAAAYVEGEKILSGIATLSSYSPAFSEAPTISVTGNTFSITGLGTIYFTTNGSAPTAGNSEQIYSSPVTLSEGAGSVTIKAIAKNGSLGASCVVEKTVMVAISVYDVATLKAIKNHPEYSYKLTADIDDASGFDEDIVLEGTFDGDFHTITGLSRPLFNTIDGGTVKNVILKDVAIDVTQNGGTNAGAICNEATGDSRIYNCGVLPTTILREDEDDEDKITGFEGSTIKGSEDVGSIVGTLSGTSRVINCFSYATLSGGSNMGGIVGNNSTSGATQENYATKTIVMNCMFYGEISGSGFPVYGGNVINNSGTTAINNYNYYCENATFDDNYSGVADYNRSWPAEQRNLTRFEYYRSILNSNRKLCTWWVNGTKGTAPTDADVAAVGIAKWVLDPSIAPYPILKKWGKYPSIINLNKTQVWDPRTKAIDDDGNPIVLTPHWVDRKDAPAYQGKSHNTLTITVKTGSYPGTLSGLSARTETWEPIITEMDTLNYDYGYYKVQLPYYNEVFGDSTKTDHLKRYWGNYTEKVVTAWKITSVDNEGSNSFVADWEKGYNYADRNCTDKDLYASNGGRAFAQGGFYYVPEGVKAIEIEAYWGDAYYLHGKDHALDRVNVTNSRNYGNAFTPAGTLPTTMPYNDIPIYDDFTTLMTAVKANTSCNVYEQAVVLVGNYPLHAQNDINMGNSGNGGFTLMSADFDMDNEPDFCLPLQWRSSGARRPIMPIRFDFLPVPELGQVMRHNTYAYAIGIFVPEGYFEITETSFMHFTQFEYMSGSVAINHQQPLILNGGQFEQIVCHRDAVGSLNYTRNIIMGGHIWMKRFSPGSHTQRRCYVRHCAVSVMGGDFPEFYLTGLYWTDVTTGVAYDDNPHCYTNGGRFGTMAGAGMEAVKNSVYFEIDHSVIDEFYGGGINSKNPVAKDIHVTINNSIVNDIYCGGPKVGPSLEVETKAKGTIFNKYFGGGNGGTNLYRQQIQDLTPTDMPGVSDWNGTYGFTAFKPIAGVGEEVAYDADLGYHAEFEFEVFNQSNGIDNQAVARTYYHWAQFGLTSTSNVTNTLEDCTVKHNFYGGGNLATVTGTVTSKLKGKTKVVGSAFGAGYSAAIPSFSVHSKTVTYPYRDPAGVCHNGKVETLKDGNDPRLYTWCYKNSAGDVFPAGVTIPSGVTTSKPVFQDGGKWYCYTTVSLENLGTVTGNVTLSIEETAVVEGKVNIGEDSEAQTGGVFGGGDASAVVGNTVVKIDATGQQNDYGYNTYNVFGGGNKASVTGNSTVTLEGKSVINGSVYGGGNEAPVSGNATVNILDEE